MFKLGAAKVIASDLVVHQLELSKERDKKAGIPEGFVEYYQHDAKIPKQLSTEMKIKESFMEWFKHSLPI